MGKEKRRKGTRGSVPLTVQKREENARASALKRRVLEAAPLWLREKRRAANDAELDEMVDWLQWTIEEASKAGGLD